MKQEHIIDVISILLTIILLYALILAIKTFYVPAPLDIAELYKVYRVLSVPEPVEFMQYVFGVLCTPAFLWFSYSTIRHSVEDMVMAEKYRKLAYVRLVYRFQISSKLGGRVYCPPPCR